MNGYENCNLTDTYKRGFTWDEALTGTLHKVITRHDVVLECDAHIGTHTALLSTLSKKVYALESYAETYNLLARNVASLDNVIPINACLSSEDKEVRINLISHLNPRGYAVTDESPNVTIPAPCPHYMCAETLDSFSNRLSDRDPITCIKITNNSYNILRNSEKFIQTYKPTFIISNDFDETLVGSFLVNTVGGYESKSYRREWTVYTPTPVTFPSSMKTPGIIVVDDFYDTPDDIREYALGLEYQPPENHGAVGYRCEARRKIQPGTKQLFEKMLHCTISSGTEVGQWDYSTNGCFQWGGSDTPIVYHADSQAYAAIIYLTPDAPPRTGTSFMRHRTTKIRDCTIFSHDWYDSEPKNKEPHLDKKPWETVDSIGNVYNRLVIFKATNIHSVTDYFGEQIHDSRLFQLFFFNINQ